MQLCSAAQGPRANQELTPSTHGAGCLKVTGNSNPTSWPTLPFNPCRGRVVMHQVRRADHPAGVLCCRGVRAVLEEEEQGLQIYPEQPRQQEQEEPCSQGCFQEEVARRSAAMVQGTEEGEDCRGHEAHVPQLRLLGNR
jgi:hypothetical protein